jgi:hypothetical protein
LKRWAWYQRGVRNQEKLTPARFMPATRARFFEVDHQASSRTFTSTPLRARSASASANPAAVGPAQKDVVGKGDGTRRRGDGVEQRQRLPLWGQGEEVISLAFG